MLEIGCTAHVDMEIHKKGRSADTKVKMRADLASAIEDTASVQGVSVSVTLMLLKWRSTYGEDRVADDMEKYLREIGGLCARVVANQKSRWGCPTTNNGSE